MQQVHVWHASMNANKRPTDADQADLVPDAQTRLAAG